MVLAAYPLDEFTIGKLSASSGVNVETIRYYERRGLLAAPPRTGGGYRSYDGAALWRLEFIRRAKQLGFTLGEITELFGAGHSRSAEEVLDAAHAKLQAVEDQLRTLSVQRCQLRQLVEVCRHGDGSACVALEIGGAL